MNPWLMLVAGLVFGAVAGYLWMFIVRGSIGSA
jgi:hypothetical protein